MTRSWFKENDKGQFEDLTDEEILTEARRIEASLPPSPDVDYSEFYIDDDDEPRGQYATHLRNDDASYEPGETESLCGLRTDDVTDSIDGDAFSCNTCKKLLEEL